MFVHCGLHKTGTTAIQTAFAEHRDRLRAHGVLYPSRGSHQVGHHNLAWELTGDRRFDPAALTLARVVREIAAFGGDVVLSSEDFESILDRADLIAPLLRQLGTTRRDIRVVVYASRGCATARQRGWRPARAANSTAGPPRPTRHGWSACTRAEP